MSDSSFAPPSPPARLRGPGLAKTRGYPLVTTKPTTLVRTTDARWRALFEMADVMSEGAPTGDAVPFWYGSSSIILPQPPLQDPEASLLELAASRDLHVRVRAMRMAVQEAALRAPAPLGRATCEVRIRLTEGGIRIDVDVEAPLIERHRSALDHSD